MVKSTGYIVLLCLLFTELSTAQPVSVASQKLQAGLSFSSFGENDVFRFSSLDGEASYAGENFYTLGIIFLKEVNKTFDVESGVEYSHHTIIISPNVPPDIIAPPYRKNFSLLSIPVSLRVTFAKYCFLLGGVFMDMDTSPSMPVSSQTGLGVKLGLGAQYQFNSGIAIFASPYLKAHSLLGFSGLKNHQHLMESGVRFGVLFEFPAVN